MKGRTNGQALERSRLAAIAGGEVIAVPRCRSGQFIGNGGTGVGERSQSRISKPTKRH